jgi:hypothetical protein
VYKHLQIFVSSVCLVFFAIAGHAETDVQTAEALMRKSGFWQQLAGLAPQIRAGFLAAASQSKASLSPAESARVIKILEDAYSPDRLRAASLAVLVKELDPRRVPALDRWFAEPLGQRITKLEEAASNDPSSPEEQMMKGSNLLKSLPESRRTVIAELVKVTRSVELMADLTIETALAVGVGAASANPGSPSISSKELRMAFEAQRPQMLVAFHAMAMGGFASAYTTLSTDELKNYIRFLKSDAGSHFNESGSKAFGAALKAGATELGRRLPGTKDGANT